MTLGGLALAVGILVDEATVAIENIHTHLSRGTPVARARARRERRGRRAAAARDAVRRGGVRAVVLHDGRVALAVRAAVAGGRLRDDRVVPALEHARAGAVGLAGFGRASAHRRTATRATPTGSSGCAIVSARCSSGWRPRAWLLVAAYLVVTVGVVALVGLDARPRDLPAERRQGQFQLRFRAPAGTKFESTERLGRDVLDVIRRRPARTTSTSRSDTSACSPRRIRSTRSSCGPAARTKACCRSR